MTDLWLPGLVDCEPGFDAAFLPRPVPKGFTWCMAYAGGTAATHPWTEFDLQAVATAGLAVLPVWVPDISTDNPHEAGLEFATWLYDHKVPPHTPVLLDMETSTDARFAADFCNITAAPASVRGAAALNLTYGSTHDVLQLPRRSGHIPADWTGQPHLVQEQACPACQYAAGKVVPGVFGAIAVGEHVIPDVVIDEGRTASGRRAQATGEIDLDVAARWLVAKMWRPA